MERTFRALAWLVIPIVCLAQNQITYTYDEIGGLISVVAPSGESAGYTYDAVGNLLSITRQGPPQPSIASFSPSTGPAVTTVWSGPQV